jgi:Tfp pilus assembly protein PilF
VAARICVAVVALGAIGWLGVMERNLRLQERSAAALRPGTSAAALARAESDLRNARLLNPDTAVDIDRAVVYRTQGDRERALALAEDVVRREPDNLRAWVALALLAGGTQSDAPNRARAALRRLDPFNSQR